MFQRGIFLTCLYVGFGGVLLGSPLLKDSVKFDFHFKKAEILKKDLKFADAIRSYKAALGFSDQLVDKLAVNRNIAAMFYGLNSYDSARHWINKNVKRDEHALSSNAEKLELAKSYYLLRGLCYRAGDYREALEATRMAIEILELNFINSPLVASYYVDLGIAHWRMKDYTNALVALNKAIDMAEKQSSPETAATVNRAYMTLGLTYWNMSDLTRAVHYYQQVFRYLDKNQTDDANIRDYALNCSNIAAVYKDLKEYDSTIKYLNKAIAKIDLLAHSAQYQSEIDFRKVVFYGNMGLALMKIGQMKEAERFYTRAIALQNKQNAQAHPETARILFNLGNLYLRNRDFELARKCYTQALDIQKKRFGTGHSELCVVYNCFADLALAQNRGSEATRYYDSAIACNQKRVLHNEEIYSDVKEAWYSFAGKIEVLSASRPTGSTDGQKDIDNLYLQIRSHLNYTFTRSSDPSLQSEALEALGTVFDAFYSAYAFAPNQKYLERLWEISEYKKAIKLTNAFAQKTALNSIIPTSYQLEERKLKDSMLYFTEQSLKNAGRSDSQLFQYQRKYDQFVKKLESTYPRYYSMKYTLSKTPLSVVIRSTSKNKLITNFVETSKGLYSLIVSKDTTYVIRNDTKVIDSLATIANQSLKSGRVDKEAGYNLRLKIFGNEINLQDVRWMDVIPDGVAWKIHFSLLADQEGASPNDIDIIGKRVNITYQYSFEYLNLLQKSRQDNNRKVLAFSYSGAPNESGLAYTRFGDFDSDIPGTSTEIKSIAKDWNGDYYFSKMAKEVLFKAKCKEYQIIHLALHGAVDEKNPNYSVLRFNQSDSLDDGFLYAHEIANIPMSAELAVLSACNSGTGKVQTGEGIESIGRSFALAGVNSLLLSKWEVSDLSAPLIIKYFYEGLKKGLPKSEALRLAKLTFLRSDADNITSQPFYWDYFYVMGDDRPLLSGNTTAEYIYRITGILFLFVVFLRLKKKLFFNRV